MALTTGLVVANNYYNQPLLGIMARSLQVSEMEISSIPMLTQIGYAVGLFLIVPLGDMLRRKKMILIDFVFIIAALLAVASATSPLQLKIASFFVGLTSVVPQIMVPMAAQLASDEKRGAAIGTVMTGMFIGILGSRTVSGLVGAHFSWQTMYWAAAAIMLLLALLLLAFLPEIKPDFKGTYNQLIRSIVEQFRTRPSLRWASLRGAFDFASFSVFWTTLVFLLESPAFNLGSDVAGSFGLVGIAGALMATVVGKLSDRMNKNKIIIGSIVVIMLSWILIGFAHSSLIGLIIGALFLDLGIQSVHITNQTVIFEGNPSARNRINTVYMVFYFIGGSFGTFVGGIFWEHFRWTGVCIAGMFFSVCILLIQWLSTRKRISKI